MKCKHCGKLIIKVVDRYYHKDNQKYFCNRNYAEPFTKNEENEN